MNDAEALALGRLVEGILLANDYQWHTDAHREEIEEMLWNAFPPRDGIGDTAILSGRGAPQTNFGGGAYNRTLAAVRETQSMSLNG